MINAQSLSIRERHLKKLAHRGAIQIGEITVMTEVSIFNQGKKQPIKASEIDPTFKYELQKIPGAEKILRCFQCGTCTSDCPIARFSDTYRPRTLIHMAQLGLKDRVLNSDTLWLCAACFTCTDRCPQNIDVDSVIRVFRNLAVEKGCIPQMFCDQAQNIVETGYAYKMPQTRIKKRESQSLPPLPKGNTEALKKLLKGIKFFERVQPIQKPQGENKNEP
ncbi:4Fe-4S dicluster domain-containing protein [Candidatus Bathycorpusculum sp.]|uniref:4Fe-4S dicluster domain-containing protein n=1 Tax=Candidatus Bathycorpusculum sp. TaxID=2994959 RepID=UPI00283703C8|nr:4Fe-4S dicluster domain-containing protein [Candidatus Termitimicrobium sp.]